MAAKREPLVQQVDKLKKYTVIVNDSLHGPCLQHVKALDPDAARTVSMDTHKNGATVFYVFPGFLEPLE